MILAPAPPLIVTVLPATTSKTSAPAPPKREIPEILELRVIVSSPEPPYMLRPLRLVESPETIKLSSPEPPFTVKLCPV